MLKPVYDFSPFRNTQPTFGCVHGRRATVLVHHLHTHRLNNGTEARLLCWCAGTDESTPDALNSGHQTTGHGPRKPTRDQLRLKARHVGDALLVNVVQSLPQTHDLPALVVGQVRLRLETDEVSRQAQNSFMTGNILTLLQTTHSTASVKTLYRLK